MLASTWHIDYFIFKKCWYVIFTWKQKWTSDKVADKHLCCESKGDSQNRKNICSYIYIIHLYQLNLNMLFQRGTWLESFGSYWRKWKDTGKQQRQRHMTEKVCRAQLCRSPVGGGETGDCQSGKNSQFVPPWDAEGSGVVPSTERTTVKKIMFRTG